MTEQTTGSEPDRLATVTVLPTARTTDPDADTVVLDSARRVLADAHQGGPAATVVEKVDLDDWDDRPLIPAWTRTAEGWAAWAGRAYRSRRRAARRWLRRQRTDRGHVAQFRRGSRRLHDWVVGLEGVQVQALHHAAQIAAREARTANRTARFTPKVFPVKYKAATTAAVKATAVAEAATAAYRKARMERRRVRQMRAAVVYGPPAAAITAGYATAGGLGAAAGVLATFAGGAFAGRHPVSEERDWSADWRSLGDGDAMSAPMLDQVFRAAKVIGAEETLRVVQMPMLDARGAWSAVLDLPPGIPAKKALRATDELAAAFGVEEAQVSVTKKGRSGRIELYVTRDLPFTEKAGPGPLLAHDGPTNFWGRISIGPDVRGQHVSVSVVERSGLVGGEPGAGKSASGNTILLAAALDPRVILWLADGKGGGDLEPFEALSERFEGLADPEAFNAMLDDLIDDMKRRYATLKKLGKRKVTEALANAHPELRQLLLWVDELMFYTTDEDYGKKITKKLRNLVSRGRAAGIITFCATQKPGSDVVDTSLRDLLSIRWALRCTTPEASDTILGRGAAAAGYSAKSIEAEMRGAGYLWSEGQNPVLVRADYYNDDQVTELLERAHDLRDKAGTLPAGPRTLADRLRDLADDDARLLAVVLDTFAAADRTAQEEAAAAGTSPAMVKAVDWLPGTVLLDALAAAGIPATAERLGALVVRTDEEKAKHGWNGSRVTGYPLARVHAVIADRFGLAV
ncbi:FtsK/SpoIIIE domain-containing protein [Streptomyces sp. HPF1205]|uniref:FtsK/SpoIIIE domain-containing protein n=1 Tax=Streptomyces sp. HPF1205 TaxID=2873262 RepID=UPI001CEC1884|nr:FtsK/SpoIIIE domain-containing protein [Streptomyces sp. HPF1205]